MKNKNNPQHFKFLRAELIVRDTTRGFRKLLLVKDPDSGISYQFRNQEINLLEMLNEGGSRETLSKRFAERFSVAVTDQQINVLLARLERLNFLAITPEALFTDEQVLNSDDESAVSSLLPDIPPESATVNQPASDERDGTDIEPPISEEVLDGENQQTVSLTPVDVELLAPAPTLSRTEKRGGKRGHRRKRGQRQLASADRSTASETSYLSEDKKTSIDSSVTSPEGGREKIEEQGEDDSAAEVIGESSFNVSENEVRENLVTGMMAELEEEERLSESDNSELLTGKQATDNSVKKHSVGPWRKKKHIPFPPPARRSLKQNKSKRSQIKVQLPRKKGVLDQIAERLWPLKYLLLMMPALLSYAVIQWHTVDFNRIAEGGASLFWLALLLLPMIWLVFQSKQVVIIAAAHHFSARNSHIQIGKAKKLFLFETVLENRESIPWVTQIWITLCATAVQLLLFSGALLWLASSDGVGLWPLSLLVASWITLLVSTSPWVNSDAKQILTTYFTAVADEKLGVEKVLLASWQRIVLGLLQLVIVGGLALLVLLPLFDITLNSWELLGLLLTAGICSYKVPAYMKRSNLSAEARYQEKQNPAGWQGEGDLDIKSGGGARLPRNKPVLLLLLLVVVIPWLPYDFEVSGEFNVLPAERQEVHSELVGLVEAVFVEGGEWVEKGEVIAVLEAHEYTRDVNVNQAKLTEKEANLQKLLDSPRPEELKLARTTLEVARVRAKFSADELIRFEELYRESAISLTQLEDVKLQKEVDSMKVLEQEAQLELVKSGSHPKEITAAKAEISRILAELDYYKEQVERAQLRMPFSARIITLHLQQKVGQYLKKGDLFAEVETQDRYLAEVFVSEHDAAEVRSASFVRLKFWAYPDKIFIGEVATIDPVVTKGSFGSQVRVVVGFDNDERLLASGMTGVAKIKAEDKRVWEVFTRLLVSFFSVEVWSWLP